MYFLLLVNPHSKEVMLSKEAILSQSWIIYNMLYIWRQLLTKLSSSQISSLLSNIISNTKVKGEMIHSSSTESVFLSWSKCFMRAQEWQFNKTNFHWLYRFEYYLILKPVCAKLLDHTAPSVKTCLKTFAKK